MRKTTELIIAEGKTTRTKDHEELLKMQAELLRLFVARIDVYAIQLKQGSYVKVSEQLTLEFLQEHLEGKITLGIYQLDTHGMCKWLCFDFDPERFQDQEQVKRAITGLLGICFEKAKEGDEVERPRIWHHAVLLEASRYPDPSFHVWVLFATPVLAKVARWLGLRLLELANLNPNQIELFPKQTELLPERPYGNLVKLPLGLHQREGKWSRLLDFETFNPLPNETLFDKFGLTFSYKDLEKILNFKQQNSIQTALPLPENYKPLKDREEEQAVRFLVKYWRKGKRNQLEMAFLGYCIKKGVAYESARRIIERVCDLTKDEEKPARLQLVGYHYRNRRSLGNKLTGVSVLREIVRGLMENEHR
ncbi:MAG: TOTE conflict system archaeo-eukaryotic primase domain-containing protein [Candidatus Bathycorpusculaceae bacterium]